MYTLGFGIGNVDSSYNLPNKNNNNDIPNQSLQTNNSEIKSANLRLTTNWFAFNCPSKGPVVF